MKNLTLSIAFALITCTAFASYNHPYAYRADTVKLSIDSDRNVYYQRVVKLNNALTVDVIYNRAVQFMASKNIQQNYGYEQDGRLIFTTSQDLNINPVYVGDDNDGVDPYTIQFAVTLDLKRGSYRYTINNVTFFHPINGFNKRETLLDVEIKATQTDSKRIARAAKAMINSFERYLATLTQELRMGIEQKAGMYNPKF